MSASLLLAPLLAALFSLPAVQRPLQWMNAPRLHYPTQSSVTLAMIPHEDGEVWIEYGPGGQPTLATSPTPLRHGQLYSVELSGLPPGTECGAVVWSRRKGDDAWLASPPRRFRTLRPTQPGQVVRVAIAADTHAWALHSRHLLGPTLATEWHSLQAALRNVAASGVDFFVGLTDTVMTECGSCVPVSVPGLGQTAAGSAGSAEDALIRNRVTWGPDLLGQVAEVVPALLVLGDHDGEAGYEDSELIAWSRDARRATVPGVPDGYMIGPPGTLSYALESGPLLLVALDINATTIRDPEVPEGWHMGTEQLAWLEAVLASSDRPWKVVMAEHLLGGISDPTMVHWKGRGGITSTADGTATAPFVGEQKVLQELFLQNGVDLFLSAHDHLVSWGMKDGIAYCIGGRAGGVGNKWNMQSWYADAMDYDGDGIPEYNSGVTGTKKPGHFELTADDAKLSLEYVRASTSPGSNGNVVVSFELLQ